MNIFEYIDKKRNEYETLRDEGRIQFQTNCNRIETLSSQIKHMTEEEENPSKFFLPETKEMYEKEIVELQDKINVLELENSSLTEKIAHWEEELQLLDELELPDFESAEKNTAWTPMVIPEEAFQKKNVSRETISEENLLANVSRETMDSMESPTAAAVNVSRETKEEETAARQQKHIKEKIQFCRQVSELDPRRCSLLLDEILKEL